MTLARSVAPTLLALSCLASACASGGARRPGPARDGAVPADAGTSATDAGARDAAAGGVDAGAMGSDAGATGVDAGSIGMDAGPARDAGSDAGRDAGTDAGRDAGSDAGRDGGTDAGRDAGPPGVGVSVEFPSMTSSTRTGTLGAGGGGAWYVTGDYIQQSFAGTGLASITRLDVSFEMDDLTNNGACPVGPLSWNVIVNGRVVGTYGYAGGLAMGRIRITQSYTFAAVAATAGAYTIRYEATTTVCPGASSWNWFPGGNATLIP